MLSFAGNMPDYNMREEDVQSIEHLLDGPPKSVILVSGAMSPSLVVLFALLTLVLDRSSWIWQVDSRQAPRSAPFLHYSRKLVV